ncbi:MAG: hypothetical protein RMM53_10740 [Bacteroidia bacterium]|nr:hypothetical protein [Bacteroidia bacterium]
MEEKERKKERILKCFLDAFERRLLLGEELFLPGLGSFQINILAYAGLLDAGMFTPEGFVRADGLKAQAGFVEVFWKKKDTDTFKPVWIAELSPRVRNLAKKMRERREVLYLDSREKTNRLFKHVVSILPRRRRPGQDSAGS